MLKEDDLWSHGSREPHCIREFKNTHMRASRLASAGRYGAGLLVTWWLTPAKARVRKEPRADLVSLEKESGC